MRRWIWRVLLTAAAVLALIGGALAADPPAATTATVNGLTLTLNGAEWTVTGYSNTPKAVVIPEQHDGKPVTAIGDGIFAGKDLTSVEIPATVKTVGDGAFASCASLSRVTFCNKPGAGPVTEIKDNAFVSCKGLTTLQLSDNIKSIGENAFAVCEKLSQVIILDGTESIATGAFAGCKNLLRVAVCGKDTKITIAKDAFPVGAKLKTIHCQGDLVVFEGDPDANPWKDDTIHKVVIIASNAASSCVANGSFTVTAACTSTASTTTCKFTEVKQELPKLEHNWLPKEETKDPADPKSCQSYEITKTFQCQNANCSSTKTERETVDATAEHGFEEKTETIKEATCTAAGTRVTYNVCKQCATKVPQKTETISIDPTAHDYEEKTITTEPTCGEPGHEKVVKVCKLCKDEEVLSATETEPATGNHNWEAAKYIVKPGDEATCTTEGTETLVKLCKDCSAEAPEDEYTDAEKEMDKTKTIDKLPHDWEGGKETITKPATCTDEGEKTIAARTCKVCQTAEAERTETIPVKDHDWIKSEDKITKPAACTEPGLKNTGVQKCKDCGYEEAGQTGVEIPALGHRWGNFTPKTGEGSRQEPTCGVAGWVLGRVECTREGCTAAAEDHKVEIEPTGLHEYGEWTITKEPATGVDGSRERVCAVCEYKDIQIIPAGSVPMDPSNPENPGDSEDPGGSNTPGTPTEPEKPATYRVDVVQASNGTTSVNRTTAQSGDRVAITVSPASGYELDMLRVISADGKVLNPTSLGSGQYRFTMPASNVEIRATFSQKSSSSWSGSNWASAPGEGTSTDPRRTTDVMPTQNPSQSVPKAGASEQRFRDIPTGHWAAGEIEWANQMGYMNGTAGRFNPDGNITHQQMWMVLARLTGSHPANMTEARRWAVEHSFADGSSPTGAVSRHQLVTALYRCAHLMGSTNRNTTSLAGYTDSSTVPAVARDAFSWAVANGIVSGTASSRLDPNGTLTRAQFAVILYRYSQRI